MCTSCTMSTCIYSVGWKNNIILYLLNKGSEVGANDLQFKKTPKIDSCYWYA